MRICPRAVDDVFIEQQPKVSNENRNKKNIYIVKPYETKQENKISFVAPVWSVCRFYILPPIAQFKNTDVNIQYFPPPS